MMARVRYLSSNLQRNAAQKNLDGDHTSKVILFFFVLSLLVKIGENLGKTAALPALPLIMQKLGRCGRQNMLRLYLKFWDWD